MPTPSDLAGSLADRDLVDSAMRRLDERDRAVIVLHYFLGMPLSDVAASLQIPIGTVKTRLHRALGAMRTEVGADPEHPSPVPGGQVA
jgi:RNA polymerase sigma-70 factor (ECF subfamily)